MPVKAVPKDQGLRDALLDEVMMSGTAYGTPLHAEYLISVPSQIVLHSEWRNESTCLVWYN